GGCRLAAQDRVWCARACGGVRGLRSLIPLADLGVGHRGGARGWRGRGGRVLRGLLGLGGLFVLVHVRGLVLGRLLTLVLGGFFGLGLLRLRHVVPVPLHLVLAGLFTLVDILVRVARGLGAHFG